MFASQTETRIQNLTSENIEAGAEIDFHLALELSDQIKSKQLSVKDIVKALGKRLVHSNPNVIILALKLADSLLKNSGPSFISDFDFYSVKSCILNSNNHVTTLARSLVAEWAVLFEQARGVFDECRRLGVVFPTAEGVVKALAGILN